MTWNAFATRTSARGLAAAASAPMSATENLRPSWLSNKYLGLSCFWMVPFLDGFQHGSQRETNLFGWFPCFKTPISNIWCWLLLTRSGPTGHVPHPGRAEAQPSLAEVTLSNIDLAWRTTKRETRPQAAPSCSWPTGVHLCLGYPKMSHKKTTTILEGSNKNKKTTTKKQKLKNKEKKHPACTDLGSTFQSLAAGAEVEDPDLLRLCKWAATPQPQVSKTFS